LIRWGEVGYDRTRVKAYNSRYKTLTGKTLEEQLQALDALFKQRMLELQAKETPQAGLDSLMYVPLR